jgi:ubiquitin carboxyl-terminal hydrolase 7
MYAGLKNYGSTGFLNTLVQVLFHIPAFRRRIFQAKTHNVTEADRSIPLALQKLFYQLQKTRDGIVDPKELTRAFGWSDFDLKSNQHDIVEFFALFMESLGGAIEKLPQSPSPVALFDFQCQNYISCLNVPYERAVTEQARCTSQTRTKNAKFFCGLIIFRH